MQLIPQLILTLSPSGDLVAEVPGNNGARRKIVLGNHPSLAIYAELRQQADHIEWEQQIARRNTEEIRRRTRAQQTEHEARQQNIVCRAHQHIRPKTVATKQDTELALLLDL